jgi:thiamine-monophosphate kinase
LASPQTVAHVDEPSLLERIRVRVPHTHQDLILGIGDDAALLRPVRNHVDVVTTDMLVEDVHFRRAWSTPRDIGAKAIAVNLSDLGAMGAVPRVALLSIAMPVDFPLTDFDELIEGVGEAARDAGIAISGGNLTRSPGPLIVDVTAIGAVHPRKTLLRGAARADDDIYVTGTIGAGAAGLAWLQRHGVPDTSSSAWPAVRRACRPSPPLRAGVVLSRAGASRAAIDLSDGLADGLRRLSDASGRGVTVDAAALPIDPSARAIFEELGLDPLRSAVAGGDDYELLFTVSARNRGRLRSATHLLRTHITRIGNMTPRPGLELTGTEGQPIDLASLGFDHFSTR